MRSDNTDEEGLGVVVIGRNEGVRLVNCINSVKSQSTRVVYVDSGSSDESVNQAQLLGTVVVELDMTLPFSAARARNAGVLRMREFAPDIAYVQFVDGDCELVDGWCAEAIKFLQQSPQTAIVAGRLNELYPESSIYNYLGDFEWNFSGLGEVDAVGGIFMVRTAAFDEVGGFNNTVFAGEEPELCQRLRQRGWKIWRIDRRMAWHDLAMTRFSQWWTRQIRGGYGGLDVAIRFGIAKHKRNAIRVCVWGFWTIALLTIAGLMVYYRHSCLYAGLFCALLSLWVAQMARIWLNVSRREEISNSKAVAYAWFTMVSYWAQFFGQMKYVTDAWFRRPRRLIEYKKIS